MTDARRRLMWHGVFLFLLGLLSGLVEQAQEPRMGLAAHLEGLMNGTFLLALGAAWTECGSPRGSRQITFWLALYGAYVNWATTIYSGAGHRGADAAHRRGSQPAGA
jgi:hydroxylaminobenzene mutase